LFFPWVDSPSSLGLFIVEVSKSRSDTAHSEELLRTRDRPVADTFTRQHADLTRDIHALAGFEPAIPANEQLQAHSLDRKTTGIIAPEYYLRPFEIVPKISEIPQSKVMKDYPIV
jgi:hypothetical protein